MSVSEPLLLAVDLGVRAGFAFYAADGRLIRYASHNYGSAQRLRRGAASMLNQYSALEWVVLEGGGHLAEVWERAAEHHGLNVLRISAERWRTALLYSREQRHGAEAKAYADDFARKIIAWSDAPRPTSLRHDAAEAIMVGFWAVLELGWLSEVPREIRAR